jgi:Zn-dependent M28 family amino/carboxypeptidase
MINYDMVGRFKETVMFYGAGSTPQFKKAAAEVSKSGGKIKITDSSGGGSDHASFARKGIPVTFFHTGQHAEYHTPDDTPDRINFKGLKDVTQWTFHYCWLLDKEESFPRVNLFVPQGEWKDHNMD